MTLSVILKVLQKYIAKQKFFFKTVFDYLLSIL